MYPSAQVKTLVTLSSVGKNMLTSENLNILSPFKVAHIQRSFVRQLRSHYAVNALRMDVGQRRVRRNLLRVSEESVVEHQFIQRMKDIEENLLLLIWLINLSFTHINSSLSFHFLLFIYFIYLLIHLFHLLFSFSFFSISFL